MITQVKHVELQQAITVVLSHYQHHSFAMTIQSEVLPSWIFAYKAPKCCQEAAIFLQVFGSSFSAQLVKNIYA